MNDQRDTAVTGVARGALGTATALDDTQVWDVRDLQAPPEQDAAAAPVAPGPAAQRSAAPSVAAPPAPVAAARSVVTSPDPVAAPRPATTRSAPAAAARPVATDWAPVPSSRPVAARAAGRSPAAAPVFAALALLAVLGGAAFAALSRPDARSEVQAPPAVEATAGPTPAAPVDAGGGNGGGNGGDNGKGKGNGNGKGGGRD